MGAILAYLPMLFSVLKDIGPAIEGAETVIGAIHKAAPQVMPLVHAIARGIPAQAETEAGHVEEVAKSLVRGKWTRPFVPASMTPEEEQRWFDRASGQI